MTFRDLTTLFISRKLHDYMIDYDGEYLRSLFKRYNKGKKWCLAGVSFRDVLPEDHSKVNNIERNMIE